MNDHGCIQKEKLGSLVHSVDRIEKELFNGDEGLVKSVPVLCNNVEKLTQSVNDLRTVISGFKRFQDETMGGRMTIKSMAPWIAIVLTAMGLWFGVSGKLKKTEENIQNKLWWKQDRILDSTTRSVKILPLDTTRMFK